MPGISGIERVRTFVAQRGIETRILELGASTRSSALAAQALGCTVAEIAKSVVLCGDETAVVVISGDKRVDLGKVNALVGSVMRVASPDDVKARTGYEIGGVPPFPHNDGALVFFDRSLERFQYVWAASGAQNAVMRVATDALASAIARPAEDLAQS